MRSTIALVILTAIMGVALANGASNFVTTLIAIPLGSLAGAKAVFFVFDRLPQPRRRRRSGRSQTQAKVIVLHPQRSAQMALPAPAPMRLAA
jgi:hypothetical protein